MEQLPLSRSFKELEEDLSVQPFARTTCSTRLSRTGKLFLDYMPGVFAALQQTRDSAKAAANGYQGQLRIAFSDGITSSLFLALQVQWDKMNPKSTPACCVYADRKFSHM